MLADDEISLFDLYAALIRRRRDILEVLVACVLTGALFAVLREPVYTYTTTVRSGSFVATRDGDRDRVFVASPAIARSGLASAVPMQRRKADAPDGPAPAIHIEVEADSGLVVLRSQAPASRADRVKDVHQRTVSRLLAAQRAILDPRKAVARAELDRASLRLAHLKSEGGRFASEIMAAAALTTRTSNRVDHALDVAEARQAVATARMAWEELVPSKALYVAARSPRSVGLGGTAIVLLGAALGLVLGGLIALVEAIARGKALLARRHAGGGSEPEMVYRPSPERAVS